MTAAHALDLALLEHAQERDLRLGGQVPDFVQEDRAAVGCFETAKSSLQCSGERTLFVPEELRGDERRWNGRAVHADERPSRASGALVNRASNQLLARAGLAQD